MAHPDDCFFYRHHDGREFKCRSRMALLTLVGDALGVSAPKNLAELVDRHTQDKITQVKFIAPQHPNNPLPPPPDKVPPSIVYQGLGKWYEIDSTKLMQGVYHYNASVVRFRDDLVFAYRRQQASGFSDICLCHLDENLQVKPKPHWAFRPPLLRDNEHHEDPRLWVWNDKLCVSWCNWFGSWKGPQPSVRVAVLGDNGAVERSFVPNYQGNTGERCQKNWMFFSFGRRLHFVYYMKPHIVVELSENGEVWSEHCHDWRGGWTMSDMRGGTPAVERDGEMWAFFHSHDPGLPCSYNPALRRYIVGAYAFENKPPFRVTRYTPKPLWYASERDRYLHWAPLCLFPSGLVADGDDWLISMGVNDLWSTVCRVGHKELLERMVSV